MPKEVEHAVQLEVRAGTHKNVSRRWRRASVCRCNRGWDPS